MKYILAFESYCSQINFDSKAKDLEEEKAKTEKLKDEKELQRLKNEKSSQDKELKKRRKLFRKKTTKVK
jgi:hypothetical protein